MKQINLLDPETFKWLVNQGISSIILLTLTVAFLHLGYKYTPVFVGHVGIIAKSTEKIDLQLADLVLDTKEIHRLSVENNAILRRAYGASY
jgi:hypothetical protein